MKKYLILILFTSLVFSPTLVRAESSTLGQSQAPTASMLVESFPFASKEIFSRLFQALGSKPAENRIRNVSSQLVEKSSNKLQCVGFDCPTRSSAPEKMAEKEVVKNKGVCFYGDVYNRQTGHSCPVPVFTPCQLGDIFHSQTGMRCAIVSGNNYHPVDANKDYRITLDEVTAYASSHVPTDSDLISATNIWRNGETYSTY